MAHELEPIFNPRSIAVIGASRKRGAIGNQVVENLIDSGFEGDIYPINPGAKEILSRQAYPSVLDVPGDIDIALFCVPQHLVVETARDCAKKGVKGYVVIASGFSECGNRDVEEELVRVAREGGGRVLGPNIVGLLSNPKKANASFAAELPYAGRSAMVSQSGALLVALEVATHVRHLGVSTMVSLGNMADIDFGDCVDFFAQDPETTSISLYVEGVKNGRKFIESGRRAGKPIVALKSGVSAHGAAAAASHTGSLAGSARIYEAAFKQAHIVQAENLDEFLDRSQALAVQPPMRRGDNVLVITNGGGVGVLAADAAERYGLPLHTAPADLQESLRASMPEFGSPKNPVDITGGNGVAGYETALAAALAHEWVHGVVILYCETAVTKPDEIAEGLIRTVRESGTTDVPITVALVGGAESVSAMEKLTAAGLPTYDTPSKAVGALAALREVARYEAEGCRPDFLPWPGTDQARARAVIEKVRADGRTALTEPEAKEIFAAYGLPVTRSSLARDAHEAAAQAREIGFPVVMKIVSPQILHKSDAKGVKVGLKDEDSVRAAFDEIIANANSYRADADIHGVMIAEMAKGGREVIAGSVCDPQFGPTVMVGLGGVFVEVMKDVTFRVAPFSIGCVEKMLPELRSYPLLEGVRGHARLDQGRLAEATSRLSQLVSELADEISETDANPIMLYEEGQGLSVVDARVILHEK